MLRATLGCLLMNPACSSVSGGLASRNRHPLILRHWRQAIADTRASLPEINPLGFSTASLADSTNKNKVVPSPLRFCLSTSRQSSEPASAV